MASPQGNSYMLHNLTHIVCSLLIRVYHIVPLNNLTIDFDISHPHDQTWVGQHIKLGATYFYYTKPVEGVR